MDYQKFLKTKEKSHISSGFDIDEKQLNINLFDFQKFTVKTALKKGRFAVFADCGLGKTLMQLSWAEEVFNYTGQKVLLLAPLAVVEQTKREAIKFDINLDSFDITNYEQLKNTDTSIYSGVVLDESSILKGRDGKLSRFIIDTFKMTPYKLACTATPSPNDHMELGQHSEFLGVMSYLEMLAMYFVHDGGETSKWRLRKHAKDDFWKFVMTWAIAIDNPKTLGFNHDGYDLPEIEYIEHTIPVENLTNTLFGDVAVSATEINKDLRRSLDQRIQKTNEIVNSNPDEQFIIWGLQNAETDKLNKTIDESINVQGSDKPEVKANNLNGFAREEFKRLITKTSIASFGMNYQQCHNMVFCSYDFKFEAFYQAVRRCYRFGQKDKVKVHLLVPESQKNVRKSILEKEKKHFQMIKEMSNYSANTDYKTAVSKVKVNSKELVTDNYSVFNGDCVQTLQQLPDNCADISVFSPPFAELYVYSDKKEDMGNVANYNSLRIILNILY